MSKRSERFEMAKKERERLIAHYENINCFVSPTVGIDSGAYGKKRELQHTRENSVKHKVSRVGLADNYFKYEGKATRYECKTNAGRVGSVLKSLENGYDGFIVYELNICNANTSHKRRIVTPVIMRYSLFIQLLQECNALRSNSRDGEPCIQSSSKEFYNRLSDYPIVFDSNDLYTADDFEDIEI